MKVPCVPQSSNRLSSQGGAIDIKLPSGPLSDRKMITVLSRRGPVDLDIGHQGPRSTSMRPTTADNNLDHSATRFSSSDRSSSGGATVPEPRKNRGLWAEDGLIGHPLDPRGRLGVIALIRAPLIAVAPLAGGWNGSAAPGMPE